MRKTAVLLVLMALGCRKDGEPRWEIGQDGFEHAVLHEPNGPTYVRRQVRADGCTFGDYPVDAEPTQTRVACGAVWTGTFGQRLTCRCATPGK